MPRGTKFIILAAMMLAVATLACGGGGDSEWSCIEYDEPYDIIRLEEDREVEVYSGVDTPSDGVKGHASGGAAVGLEARCRGPRGTFYRVRGTTGGEEGLWWGWVDADDTIALGERGASGAAVGTRRSAYVRCRQHIRDELADADSFKFPHISTVTASVVNGEWVISDDFQAQDEDGSWFRADFECKVVYEGDGEWRLVDLAIEEP